MRLAHSFVVFLPLPSARVNHGIPLEDLIIVIRPGLCGRGLFSGITQPRRVSQGSQTRFSRSESAGDYIGYSYVAGLLFAYRKLGPYAAKIRLCLT